MAASVPSNGLSLPQKIVKLPPWDNLLLTGNRWVKAMWLNVTKLDATLRLCLSEMVTPKLHISVLVGIVKAPCLCTRH